MPCLEREDKGVAGDEEGQEEQLQPRGALMRDQAVNEALDVMQKKTPWIR